MRFPLLAFVAGTLLSACASNGPALPAPVPGIPVQTWSVEVHDPRAQDIYMRNDAGEDMGSASLIFVDLDEQGQPVLYTDTRGPPATPGADTRSLHTIISVKVKQNVAERINEGGNNPSEYLTVAGATAMNSAALGHPAETLARVMRECIGQ